MKKLLYSLFLLCSSTVFVGQIQIYSITQARCEPTGDATTLDSPIMQSARDKLLNPANFGAGGIYPKSVSINDIVLTDGGSFASTKDIFFFGTFNIPSTVPPFSAAEVDSLYEWSMRGGKMIIAAGQYDPSENVYTEVINKKWDFEYGPLGNPNPTLPVARTLPTSEGVSFFNGPFGFVNSIYQGGATAGYFYTSPQNSKCFAKIDSSDAWAVYLDCKTLDILISDVDYVTSLGGMTAGSAITNMQDKFWANTIAFMDTLQSQPFITKHHDSLSVQKNYLAYRWYKDGQAISSANSYSYHVTEPGNYYVETTTNGGCVVKSPEYVKDNCEVFVPTAFSPNGDGKNDFACAYYPCYEKFDFTIYNRWGEVVFESHDTKTCWDGIYRGEQANTGTYAWSFIVERAGGKKYIKKGNITLVR